MLDRPIHSGLVTASTKDDYYAIDNAIIDAQKTLLTHRALSTESHSALIQLRHSRIELNFDRIKLNENEERDEEQYKRLLQQAQAFNDQERQLEEKINNSNAIASETMNQIVRLKRIKFTYDTDTHLNILLQNPGSLYDGLMSCLRMTFREFEQRYPANQSISVRIALAQFEEKANFILAKEEQPSLDAVSSLQQKYYQLCGMVWDMVQAIDDKVLTPALQRAMQRYTVQAEFALSQYRLLSIEPWSADQLHRVEEAQYYGVLAIFHNFSLDNTMIMQALNALLVDINSRCMKARVDGDRQFDLKLMTTILQVASELCQDTQDASLRDQYINLIQYCPVTTVPLLTKVVSFGLVAAGAVTVAVGSLAKYHDLDMSASASTTEIIAGSAAILGGIGLFHLGVKKGLSQRMINLSNAMQLSDTELVAIDVDRDSVDNAQDDGVNEYYKMNL